MKHVVTMTLGLLFALPMWSQNQIVGKWNASDGDAIIEMYRLKDSYYGKIIWLKDGLNADGSDKKDKKNPDEKKRNQTIKGMNVVTGLKYKDGSWKDGKVYDPASGRTYKCSVKLENGKLKLKGQWGVFSRTQTWTRRK